MQLIFPSAEWLVAWSTVGLAVATTVTIFLSSRHENKSVEAQNSLVVKQKELVDAQKIQLELQKELSNLQKKQNQLAALVEIFHLLDNNANRNARRRTINLYTDNSKTEQWDTLKLMNVVKKDATFDEYFLNSIELESREVVRADFNHVGSLINSKLVEKEQFLEIYWMEVLKCAVPFKDDLDVVAMKNFKYLTQEADEYRKSLHSEEDPLNMSKDTFKGRFRDVGKISYSKPN